MDDVTGAAVIGCRLADMRDEGSTRVTMPVMPREGDWTVEDLDLIPDDGLQYELADGVLLVTPPR